jgi:hypothetical protein
MKKINKNSKAFSERKQRIEIKCNREENGGLSINILGFIDSPKKINYKTKK